MKNKHLSYDDRLEIEKGLKDNLSFKAISKTIDKDCSTISKEIEKKESNVILEIVHTFKKKNARDYQNHLMFVMDA